MWLGKYNGHHSVLIFVLIYNGCESISNVNFNEQIRDYSVNDNVNLTNVKTLQKDDIGLSRYASFSPPPNAIGFKDVPDSALSESSHGRGLLNHDLNGYGLYEYEDPHYGHGYEVPHDSNHHVPHNYHPYDFHDEYHHSGQHHHVGGYGHHKHIDHHALAAKSLLWPIAGIALLGAAAALVSNPVLLQLGVVSGRKKRQVENLDFVKDSIKKWSNTAIKGEGKFQNVPLKVKRRFIQKDVKVSPTVEDKDVLEHMPNFNVIKVLSRRYTDEDEARMVPVPLKFKNS